MAVLAVVIAVLVVSYASSMRAYLQQRAHLAQLRAEIASSQSDIAALKQEKQRWGDDAYVRDQARQRLGWVLPGETAYQVIGADGKPLDSSEQLANARSVGRTLPAPVWSTLYGSLQRADHPAAKPAEPAGRIKPDKK